MEFSRRGFAAVWTGRQALVWGGLTGSFQDQKIPPHGVAYDPAANRWSAMPMAPLRGRSNPTAVWTGRQMIVWGGRSPVRRKIPRPPTGLPTGPPAAEPHCRVRTPHRVLTCCSAAARHRSGDPGTELAGTEGPADGDLGTFLPGRRLSSVRIEEGPTWLLACRGEPALVSVSRDGRPWSARPARLLRLP